MRLLVRTALAAALLAGAALGGVARPGTHALAAPSCPTLPSGSSTVTLTQSQTLAAGGIVCDGKVRSFDGTPLHINVTVPTIQTSTCVAPLTSCPPPLIMFLSGWSNDICQFESTTPDGSGVAGCGDYIGNAGYRWNNAWAAAQGFVSLNYTPRGWYESCGKVASTGYSYLTDSTCNDTAGEASWVHLYDRRYEIRDAQYLAGLLVDAGLIDPSRIVTTGDSGGGGPSWDLALSQDQVVQLTSTVSPATGTPPWTANIVTAPWTSPGGTHLHLAAALPMYTWTDLVDALMPNGQASDALHSAPPDGDRDTPIGVEKASYVTGLFAKGISNVPNQVDQSAQYSTPCPATTCDPTADLQSWFAAINAGEPTFSLNPQAGTVIAQVGGPLRSAFAMPVPANNGLAASLNTQKPIFVIQGITDPLFPGSQALTMINRLKSADASYPVYAFLGNVGHSYADNPADVWQQAHTEGDAWLFDVLGGNLHPSSAPVTVATTRCVAGQTLQTFTASSFGDIATQTVSRTSTTTQNSVHASPASPPTATVEGEQTDAIANGGCRTIAASNSDSSPSQISYTFDFGSGTLVGGAVVTINSGSLNASSAGLAARLWDVYSVNGTQTQTLISRTVYRFDEGTSVSTMLQNLSFELTPNAWQLQPGHQVKLELTQDDFPTWRPDNEAATLTVNSLTLSLPLNTQPPGDTPEAPLAPLLLLVAIPDITGAALIRRRRTRLSER